MKNIGRSWWKNHSTVAKYFIILITGMGNFKQGYWQGALIYFGTITSLGIGLIYLEMRFIEPLFNPSQTFQTFAVLVYIAFALFWDGSGLLGLKLKDRVYDRNLESVAEKLTEEEKIE